MRKFLLAIAMVLMVSGVTFAEQWTPTIRTVDNGNADVKTFIVGLDVSLGFGGITSIWDTNITGDVCQVFFSHEGVLVQTPLQVDSEVVGPDIINIDLLDDLGSNNAFDTHLLDLRHYSDSNTVVVVGDGWEEFNDGSNPANISATDLDGGLAGIGNMELIHETTIAICNPLIELSHVEFVQVAMPIGGACTITGRCSNPIAAQSEPPISYVIQLSDTESVSTPPSVKLFMRGVQVYESAPVPEPSTVVMLILGVLCLVGVRRRK